MLRDCPEDGIDTRANGEGWRSVCGELIGPENQLAEQSIRPEFSVDGEISESTVSDFSIWLFQHGSDSFRKSH
jgi:hypothetical protein